MTAVPGVDKLVAHARARSAIAAYEAREGDEPGNRLLAALDAYEDAGGDTKGLHSATVTAMGTEFYPLWDLHVDDIEDPLANLEQELVFAQELVPSVEILPTRIEPIGGFDYEDNEGAL